MQLAEFNVYIEELRSCFQISAIVSLGRGKILSYDDKNNAKVESFLVNLKFVLIKNSIKVETLLSMNVPLFSLF